jgi:hypothetical protein
LSGPPLFAVATVATCSSDVEPRNGEGVLAHDSREIVDAENNIEDPSKGRVLGGKEATMKLFVVPFLVRLRISELVPSWAMMMMPNLTSMR